LESSVGIYFRGNEKVLGHISEKDSVLGEVLFLSEEVPHSQESQKEKDLLGGEEQVVLDEVVLDDEQEQGFARQHRFVEGSKLHFDFADQILNCSCRYSSSHYVQVYKRSGERSRP